MGKGEHILIVDDDKIIRENLKLILSEEGEALLAEDIEEDPRFKYYAKTKRYKTKSFISLPLRDDSRVIGVMNVADKLAGTKIFTIED